LPAARVANASKWFSTTGQAQNNDAALKLSGLQKNVREKKYKHYRNAAC